MNKPLIYVAGHMLNKASQYMRDLEKKAIEAIGKYTLYVPQDNKGINDKANAERKGLPERIVDNDTDAILRSDIIVIEPAENAFGTMAELGQIYQHNLIHDMIGSMFDEDIDNDELAEKIYQWLNKYPKKKVYAHFDDIRRVDIEQKGDERDWGCNAYIYGLVLKLTNGVGFMETEDIIEELRK